MVRGAQRVQQVSQGDDPAGVSPGEELPARDHAGIDTLVALTRKDLDAVNRVILDKMQSPVALIPQLAGHIIAAGGKRLRPMLTCAAARLVGYEGDRHLSLAATVEFIHTATLLHDDVVDASGLRRGLATANAVWGNKPSVLVGDFLFSRAFELMVADGSLKVLAILSHASAVIAEGEVLQLSVSNDIETPESTYLEVVNAKTAELFAAASRIGAVVAERPEQEEQALDDFGRNLGLAFQLVDDLLDYDASEAVMGKAVGDDFRDGKITLPVLIAIRNADPAERRFWQRTLEEQEQEPGDLEEALRLLRRHGALEETKRRAGRYAAAALEALAVFPDGAIRRSMEDAVRFSVSRRH